MSSDARAIEIAIEGRAEVVPGLVIAPKNAWAVYVLAHGAGAGMRHVFLETVADMLAAAGIATLRYEFPYMGARRRRPDPPALLERTVRAAVVVAAVECPGLPLTAGGKSMGGRMTSQAAAAEALPGVRGLVFLGFPLHAPGRAGVARAAHLANVTVPMLFVQGTRDDFATTALIHQVTGALPSATLHEIDGGDHSFRVLKRSGRTADDVMNEIRDTVVAWTKRVIT